MEKPAERGTTHRRRYWPLAIPVIALVFPSLYNRATPMLFGFPFFYWYQLLWVFLATAILGIVYQATKYRG